MTVQVPKTAGHGDAPFYPQSLERGRRSVRAVMLAVAEMYIKGVSTRDVEAVMAEFGIESLSSSQVSRATKLLDEELQAWRDRPLGEVSYLFLDTRYEKMRHGGRRARRRRSIRDRDRFGRAAARSRRLRGALGGRGPLARVPRMDLPRKKCRGRESIITI